METIPSGKLTDGKSPFEEDVNRYVSLLAM